MILRIRSCKQEGCSNQVVLQICNSCQLCYHFLKIGKLLNRAQGEPKGSQRKKDATASRFWAQPEPMNPFCGASLQLLLRPRAYECKVKSLWGSSGSSSIEDGDTPVGEVVVMAVVVAVPAVVMTPPQVPAAKGDCAPPAAT